MPVVVPSLTALAADRLSYDGVEKADPVGLGGASLSLGATVPLVGSMAFSEADLGCVADRRFSWHGAAHRWQVKGVDFDAAFLSGMRGVAQIAPDHGSPWECPHLRDRPKPEHRRDRNTHGFGRVECDVNTLTFGASKVGVQAWIARAEEPRRRAMRCWDVQSYIDGESEAGQHG